MKCFTVVKSYARVFLVNFLDADDNIFTCTFQFGKEEKTFKVFQTKLRLENEAYVVMRSVAGYKANVVGKEDLEKNNSQDSDIIPSQGLRVRHLSNSHVALDDESSATITDPRIDPESNCFLFGYRISQGEKENSSQIQVISQFSNDMQKLEIDYYFCRKLQKFIEELTMFTDHESDQTGKKVAEDKVRTKIVSFR